MNLQDIYLISPEIGIAIVAAFVIIIDLFVSNKKVVPVVALVTLLIPLFLTIQLHLDTDVGSKTGFSGTFQVDDFAIFFKYLILGSTAIVILSSTQYARRFGGHQGEYYALILFSAAGMMLLASSMELITLYIALELTALPSAALAAFIRQRKSAEAGIKFLVLSAVSSAVLLYGMVLVYGLTGSSHLNEIASSITNNGLGSSPALLFGIVLITAGFGFKISAVPFQMWAPDVYEGAPTPVTGFLSVASKAAGFAIILRVFYTSFGLDNANIDWANMMAVLSAISMSVGNLIAIRQNNIKRMLAYSTVAQAGYLMVGLAAITALPGGDDNAGPIGVLFYLAGYAMTNLAAFSVVIAVSNKTNNDSINSFSGLARKSPLLAGAMALAMISLIGIPPTVGFMAKIYLFSAAMDTGLEWLAIVGVINSVISAYYYLRVVKVMFLSSPEENEKDSETSYGVGAVSAAVIAMAGTFLFGIYPEPILRIAHTAIDSLIG